MTPKTVVKTKWKHSCHVIIKENFQNRKVQEKEVEKKNFSKWTCSAIDLSFVSLFSDLMYTKLNMYLSFHNITFYKIKKKTQNFLYYFVVQRFHVFNWEHIYKFLVLFFLIRIIIFKYTYLTKVGSVLLFS